jgi:hypothetical protein
MDEIGVQNSLVYKPGWRELRLESVTKNLGKAALMMIETLRWLVVDRSNVHHDVASVEDGWITATFQTFEDDA